MAADDSTVRVLHVDDEPGFVETTAAFLEREGPFHVEAATSAAEGRSTLDGGAFDCVVSDYEMPGENGVRFLTSVRESYPELPFILYTGKGSEAIASDAISAGVTDYLQKEQGTGQYAVLANRITNAVDAVRTRRAANERQRRLETLIDNLPGIVYQCRNEPEWPIISIEGECEAITGYPKAALERGEITFGDDLIHPDDRETVWESVQAGLDAGKPFEHTFRIVTRDGTEKWIWERGRGIYEDGELVRLEGFHTDITVREERKRELERVERRLEAILEHTTTPMFMKDTDGAYVLVNRGYRELFGLDDAEIVGHTDAELFPAGMAEEVAANDLAVLDSGEPMRTEERIHVRDDERTFLSTKVPVYGDGTEPVAVFGVASDITERKARERELERQNERLEEFTSVVSHDLRNPLSVAEGYLDLVAADCDSPHIATVEDAHERMEALIDDLLELSREDGAAKNPDSVDLGTVAEGCWRNVDTDGATLVLQGDRTVNCAEGRLKQLLENLFRNAVEHSSTDNRPQADDSVEHGRPRDGDDVTVTVGTLPDGFFIEDDGPGVPAGTRERVFDAGYSTNESGTGFGLAIVEGIADAHGWKIRVTDADGGGARFEVTNVG